MNEPLEAFFAYWKTGTDDSSILSDEIKNAVAGTRENMKADGVTFVFEPHHVSETVSESETTRRFRYSGTWDYGFLKDGIWHAVPGDVGTATERETTDGYVDLYQDKVSGMIVYMYESLAANWFGPKISLSSESAGFFSGLKKFFSRHE